MLFKFRSGPWNKHDRRIEAKERLGVIKAYSALKQSCSPSCNLPLLTKIAPAVVELNPQTRAQSILFLSVRFYCVGRSFLLVIIDTCLLDNVAIFNWTYQYFAMFSLDENKLIILYSFRHLVPRRRAGLSETRPYLQLTSLKMPRTFWRDFFKTTINDWGQDMEVRVTACS